MRSIGFGVLGLVLLGLGVYFGRDLLRAEEEPRKAEAPAARGEDEDLVRLSPEELAEFGVEVATAGPGELRTDLVLPAEVVPDPDRVTHVVSPVAGIAREVKKRVGDRVAPGDLLAVLASREVAAAKADFLAAVSRLKVAEKTYRREEVLWQEKRISSEQDYLRAWQAYEEARVAWQAAERKLHVLGFTEKAIRELARRPDEELTRFPVWAPRGGVVLRKHLTLGEYVEPEDVLFVLADLSEVWVEVTVYTRDLHRVRAGAAVRIVGPGGIAAAGRIDWVSPVVGEGTRTATARVILPNRDGHWRPGLFVTARVEGKRHRVRVAVPVAAVQRVEGREAVFVATPEGFRPRPVRVGRRTEALLEILAGLEPGERYVARGAFTLKGELEKGAFAGGGHAH